MATTTRDPALTDTDHELTADAAESTIVPPPPDQEEAATPETPQAIVRTSVSIAFPVIAAAVMVGGVFLGATPRIYAAIAGILGVALAGVVSRLRQPVATNIAVIGGLLLIGVLLVIPTGIGNVTGLRAEVSSAATSGDVLRPPVPWSAGWTAIVGWLMGLVGFVTAWTAVVFKRGALALLLPLPVAAIAGISVPSNAQIVSGLAVLVLFAIGLGLLSSSQALGEGEERPPLSYELRKAVKSLPLIVAITVALAFLAQADFLFPKPVIDPTQTAQKPKTVPLSEVPDRVLFTVDSSISGPWRTGSLDVYDGEDWRLPPFAESSLAEVPRSGIVDDELEAGVKATFTVAGMEGAVLPTVPNTVGIVAEGPQLAYDGRNGNIRVAQGQIQAGLRYTVTAAALPTIEDLREVSATYPAELRQFLEIPIDPPPAAADLIARAPKTSKWDEFDFLRTYLLDNVTASGPGVPVSIDAERVQDMLAGSKEGTPFEIVAAQAMFARWIGVPSRIGYGFDGGDLVEQVLEVRPKHGATFVEVYFPGYKWLPVIGTPKKAKPTVGSDPGSQQFDPAVLPSDDVTVQLFLPVVVPPESVLGAQIIRGITIGLPIVLLLVLAYVLWPAIRKARLRSRRRAAAAAAGPRARVALAYAEFRDHATDFGFLYPTDTPLMFLDRFIPDDEHTEFAWLVTRVMWGDLQHEASLETATTAEELSRALKRRLSQAQPTTVRAVSWVSRLSLRNPYAPETDLTKRRTQRELAAA